MRYLYRITLLVVLSFSAISCLRLDDDDIGDGSYYNTGQVTFDGVTLPLTYADFYKISNVQGGELWALVLSQEFIGYGTTYTDAYLYLEVFRPDGAPLDGMYDMLHPVKYIDYAAYYENAALSNGNLNGYDFYVPNGSFIDGTLYVQFYGSGTHYFEVQLQTFDGNILHAYFEGRLRY